MRKFSIKPAGDWTESGFDIWCEDEDEDLSWVVANCYEEIDADYVVAALKSFEGKH